MKSLFTSLLFYVSYKNKNDYYLIKINNDGLKINNIVFN